MIGLEFVPSDDFGEDLKVLEEFLKILAIDFVLIPDNPLGKASVSSLVCAKMIEDELGVRAVSTISGAGKNKESILSLLKGASYASLSGIACVSGDCGKNLNAIEILNLARDFDFAFKIATTQNLEEKIGYGITHAITQPIFSSSCILPLSTIAILPSFMPIFSHKSFESIYHNQRILGFQIPLEYQKCQNLMEENIKLLKYFQTQDFYLIPLNLKKQLPYFKEMFETMT